MPIAHAKTVVHRQAQDNGVKIRMVPDHIKVILHGVGLPDGVMNGQNSTWDKLLGVEFFEVVHLPLFVGIQEHEIKRSLEPGHLPMGVSPDGGHPRR